MRRAWRSSDGRVIVVPMPPTAEPSRSGSSSERLASTSDRQQVLLAESQRLAHVGSWEMDLASGAVTWTDEMYRIAGIALGTPIVRDDVRAIVHPDDVVRVRAEVLSVIESGGSADYEMRFVRDDGTVRVLHTRTCARVDDSGHVVGLFGVSQDVTDRRALEEQLRRAQKMEALGLLAGSIAHDFNNLLSAIIGGAELARLELPDDSEAARDLDDVRQAAGRASQLTRQLLEFSRSRLPGVRPPEPSALAGGAAGVLRQLVDAGGIEELPEPGGGRNLPTGTETILIVDDEGVVRDTAKRILERHGYTVIAAQHGGEAMAVWREHRPTIDLLLTDLRMPEVSGQSLVSQLRADRPTLPVVIMSGYPGIQDAAERDLMATERFLAKPFTTESLLVQIRAALDR